MRRIAVIATGALLAAGATGCGDDDQATAGGSLSTEEFCELLEELDEGSDASDELDVEAVDEVIAVAPAELRDDLQVLRDVFAELEGFEEDDPEAFGAAMALMFDPRVTSAIENVEGWGVENCGFDPSDDGFGDDFTGGFEEDPDVGDVGFGPPEATEMPDDVTLSREPALIITWDEVDDAFNYRVEVDGRTLDTTFGGRYVAAGVDPDADVVVEALEIGSVSLGPAPNVEVSGGEALVVEWTEDPSGFYYVEYTSPTEGRLSTTASTPFVIDVPADEVDRVRFGTGVVVDEGDGERIDSPFDHDDEHWVELEIP